MQLINCRYTMNECKKKNPFTHGGSHGSVFFGPKNIANPPPSVGAYIKYNRSFYDFLRYAPIQTRERKTRDLFKRSKFCLFIVCECKRIDMTVKNVWSLGALSRHDNVQVYIYKYYCKWNSTCRHVTLAYK